VHVERKTYGAPGKRHWRVEEMDQRTRKHTFAEESRPARGVYTFRDSMYFTLHIILVRLGHKGFWPSARWFDCSACLSLPATK